MASLNTLRTRFGVVLSIIIAFALHFLLGWPTLWLRIVTRLLLLPVIAGLSYELLKWAGSLQAKPDRVFVTHGEDKVTEIFAEKLWDEFRYPAMAPFSGSSYDLKEGCFVTVTKGIPIQKPAVNEATKKAAGVFARLLAACDRLRRVVMHNEGGANKDLARFADQINSLCDKWDR